MKDVSIIVPVWNVQEYLRKCLDSLVNQTFDNYEILVINDGSPDNSDLIIEEYAKKYPDLIKSLKKENGGQASARNLGLSRANGEYILFVDSDDWVDKTIVEKLYNRAINTNSDIVICNAYSVQNGKILPYQLFGNYSKDLKKNYIVSCEGACWGQLIKRSIIVDNNLYFLEHHFYEDIAVIPSLCLFTRNISYLNENLYYYLIRSGSTMKQVTYNKSLEDIFDSLEYLSNIFKKNNSYKKYYNIIVKSSQSASYFEVNSYEENEKISAGDTSDPDPGAGTEWSKGMERIQRYIDEKSGGSAADPDQDPSRQYGSGDGRISG